MKVLGAILILVLATLLALKMIEFFREIKLHYKQIAHMNELIIELKTKQKVLNQRAKIISNSEEFQRNRLNTICFNIFETADKYFTCH